MSTQADSDLSDQEYGGKQEIENFEKDGWEGYRRRENLEYNREIRTAKSRSIGTQCSSDILHESAIAAGGEFDDISHESAVTTGGEIDDTLHESVVTTGGKLKTVTHTDIPHEVLIQVHTDERDKETDKCRNVPDSWDISDSDDSDAVEEAGKDENDPLTEDDDEEEVSSSRSYDLSENDGEEGSCNSSYDSSVDAVEYFEDDKANQELVQISEWFHKRYPGLRPRREYIIQDSSESFYIIDGDSLLLEAAQTKTWEIGQQLHLFYIIELYISRLLKHVGRCEIVFFEDVECLWSNTLMRLFRCALIQHLVKNCNLIVHHKWKYMLCKEWITYLNNERPSFIFLHDGCNISLEMELNLRMLTRVCLSSSLDVAYTSNVHLMSSKLYAIYVKTNRNHVLLFRMVADSIRKLWGTLMRRCSISRPMIRQQLPDIQDIRELLFYNSACTYWNNLTPDERESDPHMLYISQWAHYFAIISTCTLSERFAIISDCKRMNKAGTKSPRNFRNCRSMKFVEFIIQSLRNTWSLKLSAYDGVADILDLVLYDYLFEGDTVPLGLCFTEKVMERYSQLIWLVKSQGFPIEPIAFPTLTMEDNSMTGIDIQYKPKKVPSLTVVTSRLSQEYAGEVMGMLNLVENISKLQKGFSGYAFDENYHWHSGKPLRDDIDRFQEDALSKKTWIRQNQLKAIQKYSDFMKMYAETLDKGIKPVVIPTNGSKKKTRAANPTPVKKKVEKKSGKAAQLIIEKNKEKSRQKDMENLVTKWKFRLAYFEKIKDPVKASNEVLEFMNSLDHGCPFEEPIFYLLKLQFGMWQKNCLEENKSFVNAVNLIHSMHKILQEVKCVPSDEMKAAIAKYFRKIGYEDVAKKIYHDEPDEKVSSKYFIDIPYSIFQMQHMGHLMKRNERSDPDERVSGFIPDTWQRELLDVVDNHESALIVAPTSSGKTFCSYYCIEKILREGNDGIVVYVTQTKALVNQVHASVYSRFTKTMSNGETLVGEFTRDHQHNAMTCQVLVTVPQCLEILLLSPKRQNWASRLRYVIFDEVHCIGGEMGGEVWEHLLTLIRCPFLALSATIGNPEEFHKWLSTVQEYKYKQECQTVQNSCRKSSMVSSTVKLVKYNERYSDIKASIFIPNKNEASGSLVETHPCMFLDSQALQTKGFPHGMNLSPEESFELWLCGKHIFRDEETISDNLEAWCPTKYFKDKIFISKCDARQYEVSLKEHLFNLIKDSPRRCTEFIEYFRNLFPIKKKKGGGKHIDIPGISDKEFDICQSFPALIETLKSADKLPVLVFMNDRLGVRELAYSLRDQINSECEKTLKNLKDVVARADELEEILMKWAKTLRDDRTTVVEYGEPGVQQQMLTASSKVTSADQYLALEEHLINKREKKCRVVQGTRTFTEELIPHEISSLQNKLQSSNIPKMKEEQRKELLKLVSELHGKRLKIQKAINECTFATEGVVTSSLLDRVLEKAKVETDLLMLGIGYHHSGCNVKYRRAVEILFRSKYLQVVTSTATLALGIHMPCKTVVIVGDDPYVDALSYRQMIGRSGRRGFDNIGNVVFYGVPVQKISKLVKADLSSLVGSYPISCSLVLRLLLLVSNCADEQNQSAHEKAMAVLSHPFFTHRNSSFQKQLQHFFLYSTDHLIRQQLVDDKGIPLQFAGLVSHLHYLEPGNMVFVSLLRKGIFHKICKPSGTAACHIGYTCRSCRISPIIGKMFQLERTPLYFCERCCNIIEQNQRLGKEGFRGNMIGVDSNYSQNTYSEITLRLLVCILCHIFVEEEIPTTRLTKDGSKLKNRPTLGSKVLLDPLPSHCLYAVNSYNKDVKTNFSNYLRIVGKSIPKHCCATLPLSQREYKMFQTEEQSLDILADNVFIPFAFLSGCTIKDLEKHCLDREEVFRILHPDIFMDFKSIPVLDLNVSKNAYALDFFKHGSKEALDEDNHIRGGDIFHYLKNFMLIIMSIDTALEQLGPDEIDDPVIGAFNQLSFEYRQRFQNCYPDAKIKY